MKSWWKKKTERWANEFIYGLSDEKFEEWVRNVRFYRSLKKSMDEVWKPIEFKIGYGAITFSLYPKEPKDSVKP